QAGEGQWREVRPKTQTQCISAAGGALAAGGGREPERGCADLWRGSGDHQPDAEAGGGAMTLSLPPRRVSSRVRSARLGTTPTHPQFPSDAVENLPKKAPRLIFRARENSRRPRSR